MPSAGVKSRILPSTAEIELPVSIRIKICGITTLEDATAAVDAGADALGFVFYEGSPRCVRPETVRHIAMNLPPLVVPVGVFVNEDVERVRETMDTCGLALAQLHGEESVGYCERLGRPVVKAIRLKDRASFLALAEFQGRAQVRGFVIDTYSQSSYGGTGEPTDWAMAAEAAKAAHVFLAGGLTPNNVTDAVRLVHPYGVDVSSGVESSPGIKDHDKLRRFVQAARLASL